MAALANATSSSSGATIAEALREEEFDSSSELADELLSANMVKH